MASYLGGAVDDAVKAVQADIKLKKDALNTQLAMNTATASPAQTTSSSSQSSGVMASTTQFLKKNEKSILLITSLVAVAGVGFYIYKKKYSRRRS